MKKEILIYTYASNRGPIINIKEMYAAETIPLPTPEQLQDPEFWKPLLERQAYALARAYKEGAQE